MLEAPRPGGPGRTGRARASARSLSDSSACACGEPTRLGSRWWLLHMADHAVRIWLSPGAQRGNEPWPGHEDTTRKHKAQSRGQDRTRRLSAKSQASSKSSGVGGISERGNIGTVAKHGWALADGAQAMLAYPARLTEARQPDRASFGGCNERARATPANLGGEAFRKHAHALVACLELQITSLGQSGLNSSWRCERSRPSSLSERPNDHLELYLLTQPASISWLGFQVSSGFVVEPQVPAH